MTEFFYIYKITNNINNKYYIGRRRTNKNPSVDKYLGSGVLIKRAVKCHGKENFKKIVLCECANFEELLSAESYYVNQSVVDDPLSYNIDLGGRYSNRNIITNALIAKKIKEEFWTEERKLAQSQYCKKIGILPPSQKGRIRTQESKDKNSAAQKGKIGTFLGKKHSDETKELIRLHNLETGKIPPNQAGKFMWTNGIKNKMQSDCPGEGWVRGCTRKHQK